jgi:hypothetical protein
MKRFRINQADQIIILARYRSEIIEKQMYFGYSSLKEIKNKFLECLPYEFKNKGRRIELTIFNSETNEYKYIDTFS